MDLISIKIVFFHIILLINVQTYPSESFCYLNPKHTQLLSWSIEGLKNLTGNCLLIKYPVVGLAATKTGAIRLNQPNNSNILNEHTMD